VSLAFKFSEGPYYAEDPNDTGLRFTDVLFGFALREVVLRLVRWVDLTNAARVHLVLATVVILGSYIGFRNSQKRGKFKLRFFNLAVLRFGLDQAMVFLYFLLALSFPVDSTEANLPDANDLLRFDARVVLAIFALYFLWDLVSHGMAGSGMYFTAKCDPSAAPPISDVPLSAKQCRTWITVGGLVAAAIIWAVADFVEPAGGAASAWIGALIVVGVAYRCVKDGLQEK